MNLVPARVVAQLPGTAHAGLIGMRPEDILVDPDGPILMRVQAVEELGAQRLVHGKVDGEGITVTLPSDAVIGDEMRLSVPADLLHYFDEKTGMRLR